MRAGPFSPNDLSSLDGVASRGALPGDLVRALHWIGAHLSEPIRIEALARVADVSPRTLEAHFRDYLGTTPIGWVRRTRLAFARRQFLMSDGTESVTDVAVASGFSQFGRFARQYREAFGELPSQTRREVVRSAAQQRGELDDEAAFLTWRALTSAFQVAPQGCSAALEDVTRAQERAPRYGLTKAIHAWCLGQRTVHHFDATSGGRERSVRLAQEALALAPRDALTLSLCSGAMTLAHRTAEADSLIERALAMDPWSAMAWIRRGWISAYLGDSGAAIRELNLTLHLMPFEPIRHIAFIGIGCAHFAAGRYDRAVRWVREGTRINPGSFWADRVAVAAAVHAGAREEARRAARTLLRKDPDLTVAMARKAWPFTPRFVERLGEGLERAGVPRA